MRNLSAASKFSELEPDGERVAVGFRPSGELHVGNLLSIVYAAVIAEKLELELDLMCCDTDWSAHIHENHKPENSDVMKLFFQRDCGCDERKSEIFSEEKTSRKVFDRHENVAEHRVAEIMPFLEGLEETLEVEVDVNYLSDLEGDEEYVDALRTVLKNMDEFDEVFGGGFRRRYRSPVVNVCGCGFSHSKGAAFSERTDELVFACRNEECPEGFASGKLSGRIGVYYLVDPVRDPSRNVAVHVFGGDYRDAEKEQKTPKVEKVAKITELATGETPEYFLAPMIVDEDGKPLSKSKGTGKTVSEIDDLEGFGRKLVRKVEEWIGEEKRFVAQEEVF
ncbi:MAG: hypothetical protein ABEJ83_04225 [Candidatus Nanohaloarchaea archaeon]